MPADKPWGSCNPNSGHQTWAKWVFAVHVHPTAMRPALPDQVVLENLTRFFGKLTRGSSAELRMERPPLPGDPLHVRYLITLRWDQRQALDTLYQQWVLEQVTRFWKTGCGEDAVVTLRQVTIEAGDGENGQPVAQLLVLPRLDTATQVFMA